MRQVLRLMARDSRKRNCSEKPNKHFDRTHAGVLDRANAAGKVGTIAYVDQFESVIGVGPARSTITAPDSQPFSGGARIRSVSAITGLAIGKPQASRSPATLGWAAADSHGSTPSKKRLYWSGEKRPLRGLLRQSRSIRQARQTCPPLGSRQGRSRYRDRRSLAAGCAERRRSKQFRSWQAEAAWPPSGGAAAPDGRRSQRLPKASRRGPELDDGDADHVDVRPSGPAPPAYSTPSPSAPPRQSSSADFEYRVILVNLKAYKHETCLSRQQRDDTGRS